MGENNLTSFINDLIDDWEGFGPDLDDANGQNNSIFLLKVMPLIQRYRKYEATRKKMEALKNIRYLFESFAENEDEQILSGLKAIKEKMKISAKTSISASGFNSLRKIIKPKEASTPNDHSNIKEDDDFEYFSKRY